MELLSMYPHICYDDSMTFCACTCIEKHEEMQGTKVMQEVTHKGVSLFLFILVYCNYAPDYTDSGTHMYVTMQTVKDG